MGPRRGPGARRPRPGGARLPGRLRGRGRRGVGRRLVRGPGDRLPLQPLDRGLGSSAAAAVAGVTLAYRLLDLDDLDSFATTALWLAAEIEGHPDNAAAAALGGLAAAPSASLFVGAGLVLGLGFYMVHNTIQTRVTEVAPEARGSAVALHAFHFYVGQSLGPVAVGAASGLFGAGAAFALAGLGMLALGWRLGRR